MAPSTEWARAAIPPASRPRCPSDPNTGLSRHLVDGAGAVLIGTRVMRPEYGSRFFELVDRPVDAELLVDLYAESHIALHRWEPCIRIVEVLKAEGSV